MNFPNTTDLQNSTSFELPFTQSGIVVSAVILITFLVLGFVGNVLTIAVITSYPKLRGCIFHNFIISLCVSDLISAMISWLFLYRRTWGYNDWRLPSFLCTLYWSVDFLTSFATSCHILSFSLLRLICIWKHQFFERISLRAARIWIAMIWFVCLCCGLIPSLFIFGPRTPDRTAEGHNSRWPACTILSEKIPFYSTFAIYGFTIFLYIPMIGVLITCLMIVGIVYSRSKIAINSIRKARKKEKRPEFQLLLIIVSFFIGYIPFTAYELWSLQKLPSTLYYHRVDYWFGMIEYIFLRFSECLNPVFYNFGSPKVRLYTKKFLIEKVLRKIQRIYVVESSKRSTSITTPLANNRFSATSKL